MPEDIQDKKVDLGSEKEKPVIGPATTAKEATGSFGGNKDDNEKGLITE